ncbi:c-type cytochrome [Rhodovulum adriaticum]|uniref:Cytochrome c n=1 Tax=Rhodovulum adriaticum TaxID=35804 RepID=A0A4R2NVW5_RHOAD|nr:cytochrome c [Rhodovulum adriaticum]MBK1636272.1 cytochrome C [Rhodovulum adriaticum]TCP26273.1 cytochrome c [Rhodovulum adriaticum]
MRLVILGLVAVIVVAGVAAVSWLGTGPRTQIAATSDTPEMVEVYVPDLGPMAATGRSVFAENCAACHGPNAGGRDGLGPPLVHRIYEPGHHGDMAFLMAARQGVRAHHWRFGDMAPVPGVSVEEMTAVIAYVRRLQRANGIY